MNITQKKVALLTKIEKPYDLLIIPIQKGQLPAELKKLKNFETSEINRHLKIGDLKKQRGSTLLFYPHASRKIATRILLVEIGKEVASQKTIADIVKNIRPFLVKYKQVGLLVPTDFAVLLTQAVIAAAYSGSYQFLIHKTKTTDDSSPQIDTLELLCNKPLGPVMQKSQILGKALEAVKTLCNQPANAMTPKDLANQSQLLATEHGLTFSAFDEATLIKMGMGGLVGVSSGSSEDAQMIIVEYNPKGKNTVAIVGKGITFDSGGISIKPAKDMHEMKYDMAGGATVLGVLLAASKLKLPQHLVGVIAATENLPSGTALKPGDVINTYSGKTVEILNTDAEGRLVLADGLSYVQKKYKPKLIIDLATLTGAVVVALGKKITGAFGNNETLNKQFLEATKTTGEDTHFLPLYMQYVDELKSTVADLSNIGKQRVDAIVAAVFLAQFIEKDMPWIHLDIAGTAWNGEGASGVMIPTIIEFLSKLKLKK
jgi:leucyl aminopeptidase